MCGLFKFICPTPPKNVEMWTGLKKSLGRSSQVRPIFVSGVNYVVLLVTRKIIRNIIYEIWYDIKLIIYCSIYNEVIIRHQIQTQIFFPAPTTRRWIEMICLMSKLMKTSIELNDVSVLMVNPELEKLSMAYKTKNIISILCLFFFLNMVIGS